MKTTIKLLILFWGSSTNSLAAQNGYPATINVSGHSIATNTITWDWSLGEALMLRTPHTVNVICINTGYLQNDFGMGIDNKLLELNTPFKIGPNPVIKNLKIISNQNGIVISKIEVVQENGQLLKIIQGPFSGILFEQSLNFASANTGTYFIMIHYVVENSFSKVNVFKIIKS
jgi:hypothetical protein